MRRLFEGGLYNKISVKMRHLIEGSAHSRAALVRGFTVHQFIISFRKLQKCYPAWIRGSKLQIRQNKGVSKFYKTAFHRVDHHFIFQTLRHLNSGDYFISSIKSFLRDKTSQVKVNGSLPDEILTTRGVRQGDPLSALSLCIIVAEVLGNLIRTSKRY